MDYTEKVQMIQSYLIGNLKDQELDDFNQWLTENIENKALFDQLQSIWENAQLPIVDYKYDYNKAFEIHKSKLKADSINNVTSLEIEKPTNIFRLKSFRMALAAVMVLVFGALFLLKWDNGLSFSTSSEVLAITLKDGSKVLLGPQSTLTYLAKNGKRNVSLMGKAYFQVAEDKNKPFIIDGQDIGVQVLGTKFSVDTENKVIKVEDGKVEVEFSGQSKILVKNQSIGIVKNQLGNIKDEIFNTSQPLGNVDLIFDNVSFADVMKDIGDKFGINFELPLSSDWDKCTFTSGSLKNNTIDEILVILKLTYELEYSIQNDSIYTLSKVNCK